MEITKWIMVLELHSLHVIEHDNSVSEEDLDENEIRLLDNKILEDNCGRSVHDSNEDGIIKDEGGHKSKRCHY